MIILKNILALVGVAACAMYSNAQQKVSLNGDWSLEFPDFLMIKPMAVKVPNTCNVLDGLEDYAGKATYIRRFAVPEDMKGKSLRLHFDGVYHSAIVSINGKEVGRHLNAGFTPFSFDITEYVKSSGDNILTVECDNSFSESNLPYKRTFDWANDGGIIRDVTLKSTGPKSLRYVHVTPKISLEDSTAIGKFDIKLWEKPAKKIELNLIAREKKSGKIVAEKRCDIKPNSKGIYQPEIDFGKINLWHFDNPFLYSFTADLYIDDKLSDTLSDHFGFRTVRVEGENITLNGEPVRLPGIENMPGSNPHFGMAEPQEYMESTVKMMKDLNTTITRFHWPQDSYRFSVMDSIGMLAQEELPWWQLPWKELTPELRESAHRQISEMIEAHYNHPSIYCWGVSNEVADNHEEILGLRDFIHERDTTRLVNTMTNHLWQQYEKDPSFSLDMPTMNEYIGTWHADNRGQLAGILNKVGEVIKGRPLLITEAGLCEPAYIGGDGRRVDEMIYHISEWQKHPYITGYIYFCLEDYRTQMGEEGIGRDRIRRHGVSDKRHNPKPSYYVLRQLMSPVEITSVKPYGEEEDTTTLANKYSLDCSTPYAEITVRAKNTIPSYTLRGYSVVYADCDGKECIIPLGNLAPGATQDVILKNVNKEYKFKITRADGSSVLDYYPIKS